MNTITLNNGITMPQLGFGVYKVTEEEVNQAVTKALEVGYRSIDTAAFYENEVGLGSVLEKSNIPREELFITTKVWNNNHGYEKTLQAFDESLDKLRLDYVDLYLVHWPCPDFNLYIETYQALEKLYKEGRAKAIGVCNFNIEHLQNVLANCEIKPAVNQVECHPYFQQNELKAFCKEQGILVEAWAPLNKGRVASDETIIEIAKKYHKTPAQITLRWHLQEGVIVIPKSVTPERIESNFQVFDFNLTEEDMNKLRAIDRNERQGREPSDMHMC